MVGPVGAVAAYAVRPFEEATHGVALVEALRDKVSEAVGGLTRAGAAPSPRGERPVEDNLFLGMPPSLRLRCLGRYLTFRCESPVGRNLDVWA